MLFLDLETFSELDLRKVALDRYASHPSTKILMCAFAIDDGPMQFWQEGEDRTELDRLIQSHTCLAWNKGFEELLLSSVWKLKAPAWIDAMVLARYASLPAGLKDCNKVPFFAAESVTSKETLLINKFCKPGKGGVIHNRETDPEDWESFCDYCRRDVADTRLIYKWLVKHFPMPEFVHKTWLLDQKINRRGLPIDLQFVWNAQQESERLQALNVEAQKTLTGLDNPNSVTQLLKWATERGYPYNSLGKELVEKAIEEMPDGYCKQALELRLAGSKSSLKKLPKILEQISPDNRLREQFRFYGAHTGRWSGRGVQLHNLKSPRTKEEKALVSVIVKLLEAGAQVDSLDALTLSLRPAISTVNIPGKKVVLSDFSSVENRVLMWLAGCDSGLQVYRDGKDPYIDFGARMNDLPYEEVSAEMRQIAKPGVLGCGFGLGGGQETRWGVCKQCKHTERVANGAKEGKYDCPKCHARAYLIGPLVKSGLWRYAEMMGIELTQADAHKQVQQFREAFSEVCQLWYYLEEAFLHCVRTKQEQRVGPLRFIYKRTGAPHCASLRA
jgi:DNA polymerase